MPATLAPGKPIEAAELKSYTLGVAFGLDVGSFTPALEQCHQEVNQAHRDNFTSSASPEGIAWPARKPRRGDDGHPLLMETGAMLQAATGGGAGHVGRVGNRTMEAGIDTSIQQGGIPGARAHEFGYPERNLPARPWLGASEKHLEACDNFIADHGLKFF